MIFSFDEFLSRCKGSSPRGVMANVLDCDAAVSEFET